MAVFSKGTPQGFIGFIPAGGHDIPISAVVVKALWKNAQKNLKKNITSETTNRINPILRPVVTLVVCIPKNVASRDTSRHHRVVIIRRVVRPIRAAAKLSLWNQQTSPIVVVRAPKAPAIGQGLRSTI